MNVFKLTRLFLITPATTVWVCAALVAPFNTHAQSENLVHVCVADDGTPTYTNNIVGLKGCKPLSGVYVTTIPAFKAPANDLRPTPTNTGNTVSARSNVGPADFPREDVASQKQRDETGRRPILERELRDREERCASTARDLTSGLTRYAGETDVMNKQRMTAMQTQVERCNADLAAIRRELSALK
jgi:hypothetical protein